MFTINPQNIQKKPKRIVNGILIIDKPKGLSSNAALQKVKRLYNAKKAGHTGSLDPLATGILPICFGTATKKADQLLASDKTYITKAQLGITTETGDSEGAIVATKHVTLPSDEDIINVIMSFKGEQDQIPSMYSALKHNGVPLYKLARQGITIPRTPRKIIIYDISLLNINRELNTIDLSVSCSKGTYIRTLVEDIGNKLGYGAHVAELRRTAAGPYDLSDMYTFEQLEQMLNVDSANYTELDSKLI
jgi:tRNA pseudouridine55 synthase